MNQQECTTVRICEHIIITVELEQYTIRPAAGVQPLADDQRLEDDAQNSKN